MKTEQMVKIYRIDEDGKSPDELQTEFEKKIDEGWRIASMGTRPCDNKYYARMFVVYERELKPIPNTENIY